MRIGPIKITPIDVNPLKPVTVKTTHSRHTVMFGGTFPVPMQSDVVEYTIPVPLLSHDPASSRALAAQLIELATNAEWQRAGIYIQMREDYGDAQDGWYGLGAVDAPEEFPLERGWVTATVDVLLRARRSSSVGTFVDQKSQPNDLSLGGVALACYPQGVGEGFPSFVYGFVGADGYTQYVVENPPPSMRSPFVNPLETMNFGRCAAFDEAS